MAYSLVWSISLHGPTEVLVERLRPMLIKYNVSAYFCGHEHDMQHIREWNGTVEYFISGAGHGIRCSADNIVSEADYITRIATQILVSVKSHYKT